MAEPLRIVRPCGYHVILKPFAAETMYKGILALPDTAKGKKSEGTAIACGEWVEKIQPGDWVIFNWKHATEVESDGEELIIVSEKACILIVEEEYVERLNGGNSEESVRPH